MKTTLKLLFIAYIILTLAGCTLLDDSFSSIKSEDSSEPMVGTAAPQPALYGLWLKENGLNRDLWSIGRTSAYLVETTGENSVRESFYTIKEVDWVNGIITMSLKWVRVDGRYGGFDSPVHFLKVTIDGDSMLTSLTGEGIEIPPEPGDGPWLRQ